MEHKIYKYGKDVIWSIPILFQYEPIWGALVKSFKLHKIDIFSVNGFGCPKTVWAGGKIPNIIQEIEPMMLIKIFKYCQKMNIIPNFTFTRINLEKEDLKDKYANYLLDMGLEFGARFIVYSDMLKDYIKEKNQNAYITSSIIKPQIKFQGENAKNWSIENETNYYNKLLKEDEIVSVRPEYAAGPLLENPSLIDDISRIEVLINQTCVKNCPKAKEHYLLLENPSLDNNYFKCLHGERANNGLIYNNCAALEEKTIEKLVEYGVKHLKIQEKGYNFTNMTMTMMLFYLIFKPEGANYIPQEMFMKDVSSLELNEFADYLNDKTK